MTMRGGDCGSVLVTAMCMSTLGWSLLTRLGPQFGGDH